MQIYVTVLGERVVSMALLAPAYFFIRFCQGWKINIYRMECDYPLSRGSRAHFLEHYLPWSCKGRKLELLPFPQRCQTEIQSAFLLHWNMQEHLQLKNSYIQCHLETWTWGQEMRVLDCAWLWILFTVTQGKEFHLFPHAYTKWLFFLMCWSDTVKL